jgi:hypothetical protein
MNTNDSKNHKQVALNQEKSRANKDLIFSFLMLIISTYVIMAGMLMPVEKLVGSSDRWYAAPGSFPIYVGFILLVLSKIMFLRSVRESNILEILNIYNFKKNITKPYSIRMFSVIFLLVVYVYSLGRIYYPIATFFYLFISMVVFKRKKYEIWKLIFFSALFSLLTSYAFAELVNIPLP